MSGQDTDVSGGGRGTGYYLPIEFENGEKGMAIKRLDTNDIQVFGETDDTDTTMILVLWVDSESPVIQFEVYASKSDAESDIDGTTFTVDCSGCSFE